MNLLNRIEKLEAATGTGEDGDTPNALFFHCCDGRIDAPPPKKIIGWYNQGRRYLKLPDEPDEQLADRAAACEKALLHHRLAVPSLFSIHEGE